MKAPGEKRTFFRDRESCCGLRVHPLPVLGFSQRGESQSSWGPWFGNIEAGSALAWDSHPCPPVLGLPSSVEEMCPDIPVLEQLMTDIGGLAESGARYTEMPHVIEITLPMLCSYLPRWWERGPEAPPPALPGGAPPPCTAVTSGHLNSLLGNILRIIVNNLGIDEASWMKRLAGGCAGAKVTRQSGLNS